MSTFTSFRGVYCSGVFVPDPTSFTALCLIFENLYIPNNIEFVKEFSKRYRFESSTEHIPYGEIQNVEIQRAEIDEKTGQEREADPFGDLTEEEKETATLYLLNAARFFRLYAILMPEVLETELYNGSLAFEVTLVRKGAPGKDNLYSVSTNKPLTLKGGDEDTLQCFLDRGYVPVVTKTRPPAMIYENLDRPTARQLAALLAMKSIEMVLPAMRAAQPETILEARDRLSDQLPLFWAAMLRVSVELRNRIDVKMDTDQLIRESQDLVDTHVRPALIELRRKMQLEKRNWFYRILSPIPKVIKLMIGNPPITQQQLLTNALLLGADVSMAAADHMHSIEALQRQSGLTYLLDLAEAFD